MHAGAKAPVTGVVLEVLRDATVCRQLALPPFQGRREYRAREDDVGAVIAALEQRERAATDERKLRLVEANDRREQNDAGAQEAVITHGRRGRIGREVDLRAQR